jgi:hypothetical protein
MTIKLEEATRKQVAIFLPKAIDKALESYYRFVDLEASLRVEPAPPATDDKTNKTREKAFTEHHSACKVALAHLELLFRLGRTADVALGTAEPELKELLGAKSAVNEYRGEKVPGEHEESEQDL